MRLFFTSGSDPRKLSMLPHLIARQSASRREFVHGKIHASWCVCKACTPEAAA
jgi:hypothetical protein